VLSILLLVFSRGPDVRIVRTATTSAKQIMNKPGQRIFDLSQAVLEVTFNAMAVDGTAGSSFIGCLPLKD
jgi:hypothetical protein